MAAFARKTLVGYGDRLSVAPGETIRFMVSDEAGGEYDAALVRLLGGDLHPQGSGLRTRDLPQPAPLAGRRAGRRQPIHAGSFAWVAADPRLASAAFGVALWVWPTTPGRGRQVLVSRAVAGGPGWALVLDEQGSASLELRDAAGAVQRVATGAPLRERCWYRCAPAVRGRGRRRGPRAAAGGCLLQRQAGGAAAGRGRSVARGSGGHAGRAAAGLAARSAAAGAGLLRRHRLAARA